MKILADENIALAREAFSPLGELRLMPGRAIRHEDVAEIDALLVRSVTRVDEALLGDSRCRFVASATAGIDHVDTGWLDKRGIAFASAPGSNAAAVCDYVIAALAWLSEQDRRDWRQYSAGIIGCGQVGSRLAERFLRCGMRVSIFDPFLTADHPLAACFTDLPTAVSQQLVSIHTPLTRKGRWPTWHMFDAGLLARMDKEAILINTARGEVVDTAALLAHAAAAPGCRLVIDAWEGEPRVDHDLLHRAALASPHIAGYSRQGKVRGTAMVLEAFCRFFDRAAPARDFMQEMFTLETGEEDGAGTELERINAALLGVYDIEQDHRRMLQLLESADPAAEFDRQRRDYPERREFGQFRVKGKLRPAMTALGFSPA